MFKNLLPKEYSFFEYFDRHINLSLFSAQELVNVSKDSKNLEPALDKVKGYVKEMDGIQHKCVEALLLTFITPIERTDIHRLIKRLDDIGDGIYGILTRMKLYKVDSHKDEFRELAELIFKAISALKDAIHDLKTMKKLDAIKNNCYIVHDIEERCDEVFKNSLANLFESDNAVEIIKWKEIFERLEKVVDKTDLSATIIESIIIASA